MLVDYQNIHLHSRTRLIVAGAVGLLVAILATFRIFFPTLAFLSQFSDLEPLVRFAIFVKLLSPLLCFGLSAGWVWVLLLIGERALSLQGSGEHLGHTKSSKGSGAQEQIRYRLARSVPIQEVTREKTASSGTADRGRA